MAITGHKTEHIFERYNIVNTDDVREALVKLGEYAIGLRTPSGQHADEHQTIPCFNRSEPNRSYSVRSLRRRSLNRTPGGIGDCHRAVCGWPSGNTGSKVVFRRISRSRRRPGIAPLASSRGTVRFTLALHLSE